MKLRSLVLGLLISAFFLYLAFRNTDWHALGAHLGGARHAYLIPASLLTLFAFWIRAVRWGQLLAPLQRIGAGTLYSATMIGFMCNNVLPMRLGEFVRAWVIGRSTRVSPSAAFATIVIERLFDLFAMAGIFGLILLFAPFHNRSFKMGVLIACLLGGAVLAFLIAYYLMGERFRRRVEAILPRPIRARVLGLLRSFQAGLEIFRDPRRLLLIGILTFAMWFCFAIVIRICFASAQLETGGATLPPLASLVVMVVMAIGIMVPSGPGFVGTLQAAAVLGLAIVGYHDRNKALSFSILYHFTQWFPVVLVGLIYLIRENLSLAQVGRLAGEEPLASGEEVPRATAPAAPEAESGTEREGEPLDRN